MGEVPLDRDPRIDREVAVKRLHPHLSTRGESPTRLLREAPGALSTDREPTGFDFAPRVITSAPRAQARAKEASEPVAAAKKERSRAARLRAEQQRAEAAAKRRRAKQEAERRRLAASLRDAERELAARARERDRLRAELARVEAAVERARAAREALAARAGALDE